jgi:cytochrome bd-type quinol oxidase subunit 2
MTSDRTNRTTKSIALLAAALTAAFFGVAYSALEGFQFLAPNVPAIGRFTATMTFGFFAVAGVIAVIFCIELLLATTMQKTFEPKLSARLLRYPKVVTLLSAIGCVFLIVALKTALPMGAR